MPIDSATARETLERFAVSHDPQYLAESAVLENVPPAGGLRGRTAISDLLRHLFYVAFADARLAVRSVGFDDVRGIGVIEWSFSGRHVGHVLGVQATGRELRVLLSAVCEVGPEGIQRSRVYVDAAAGAAPAREMKGD